MGGDAVRRRAGALIGSTAALTLAGCSAVVSDVGGVQFSPEACVQGANRQARRDARFVFAEMEAHGNAATSIALIGGPTVPGEPDRAILRGRALISPSFAAGDYDLSALADLDAPRCTAAVRAPLTMDFTIPGFLAPDATNGGPYRIDFWSETNGEPGRQPEDHTWVRPVCDDGDVFFVHNTGFDRIVNVESNGVDFTFETDVVQLGIALGAGNPAAREALAFLARLPLVVTVARQDLTVGYLRVVHACDRGPYRLPGILDVGTRHTLEVYWDVARNGAYDADCDPRCTGSIEATSEGARVVLGGMGDTIDARTACQVPANFDGTSCRS